MNINYPLKGTEENNIAQVFETYITSYYGGQAWSPVSECFKDMGKIRTSFQFQTLNVSLASDPNTCEKLEQQVNKYLQYCFILDQKFRFESYQTGCVNIAFKWNDSFHHKNAVATQQIKFEISSLLYNLAVIYYSWGCNLMSRNQIDDRKEGIKKFRYGIWALTELKNYVASVAPEVKNTHVDFSLENVSVLENMMYGLVYVCLYENLYPQRQQLGGIKNVIQLAGEAAKFFGIAKGMIDQIKSKNVQGYPADLIRSIQAKCDFHFAYYNGLTARQMAIHHESMIEDEPLGQHMGWGLSYLRKGDQLLKKVLQDKNVMAAMTPDYVSRLQNLHNEFVKELPAAEQRNAQIYKHPVKTPEQLPGTKITFQNLINLSGIKPPVFDTKPAGTEGFEGFLNEDQIQMMNECKSTADTKEMELNQALNQIVEMKTKAYLENYVNVCLDASSQVQGSQAAIPNSIKTKLDKFRAAGGKTQMDQLIKNLKEYSVNCGMMIQSIRQRLDQEAGFDQQMRQQHGQKWTRQESHQSNIEYYKKINDLEGKFKQAQQVDQDIQGKFSRIQGDITLASKSDQEIMASLPASEDQQFAVTNQVQLNELRNLDNNYNTEVTNIRNSIQNLTNLNINYAQQVQMCVQSNIPKDKIQETVLKDLFAGIDQINQKIAIVSSLIGQICGLAMELNQKRQSGGQSNVQQIEAISSGLSNVLDCTDEINGGLNFYNQLLNRLSDVEKKVNDYCYARDIEQQHLQTLIGNANQMQQQQQQNAFGNPQGFVSNVNIQQSPYQQQMPAQNQPFFNPQTNQFAVGQSTFVGGNQQQQQQQNNQPNPYGYR